MDVVPCVYIIQNRYESMVSKFFISFFYNSICKLTSVLSGFTMFLFMNVEFRAPVYGKRTFSFPSCCCVYIFIVIFINVLYPGIVLIFIWNTLYINFSVA